MWVSHGPEIQFSNDIPLDGNVFNCFHRAHYRLRVCEGREAGRRGGGESNTHSTILRPIPHNDKLISPHRMSTHRDKFHCLYVCLGIMRHRCSLTSHQFVYDRLVVLRTPLTMQCNCIFDSKHTFLKQHSCVFRRMAVGRISFRKAWSIFNIWIKLWPFLWHPFHPCKCGNA